MAGYSQEDLAAIYAYLTEVDRKHAEQITRDTQAGAAPSSPDAPDAPDETPQGEPKPGAPAGDEEDGEEDADPPAGRGGPLPARPLVHGLTAVGQRIGDAPRPGGLGGLVALLVVFALVIIPVNSGRTRLQLIWLSLTGQASLPTDGTPDGSSNAGGLSLPNPASVASGALSAAGGALGTIGSDVGNGLGALGNGLGTAFGALGSDLHGILPSLPGSGGGPGGPDLLADRSDARIDVGDQEGWF